MTDQKTRNLDKSRARLVAVQVLFEAEASRRKYEDIIADYLANPVSRLLDGETKDGESVDRNKLRSTVEFAIKNQVKIDQAIDAILTEKWKLSRIDPLLRAVFRAAGGEFLAGVTPFKVVINEYLNVVNAFQDDRETMAFANALLDALGKRLVG